MSPLWWTSLAPALSQDEVVQQEQQEGRPSAPAAQPPPLASQRLLSEAAELRGQAAAVQREAEASAAAAAERRRTAERLLAAAEPQVAAAEQRAHEDAQAALEAARGSIETAAAAIIASAEQQAALSCALGTGGAAVDRQLERARAAAAAAASAAKERLDSEVQEAAKGARARAEVRLGRATTWWVLPLPAWECSLGSASSLAVLLRPPPSPCYTHAPSQPRLPPHPSFHAMQLAYGLVKARREAAAAAAEAAAAQAGWPAEQRRLVEQAARLEQLAALAAELEAQQGCALVQQLATSGCLPLIAACLGSGADKWVQGRGGEQALGGCSSPPSLC